MVDTTFMDDVVFPVHVSQGTSGGPDWPADIAELASGFEERNTQWSAPLRSYDARWGVRTHDELYDVLKLYHVAMGRLRGFRLLDWTDYRSGPPLQAPTPLDQPLGLGDGETTVFPLVKRYAVNAHVFARRIAKPFGTVRIAVNDIEATEGVSVNPTTGMVTFAEAPAPGAALTWGGQFHVPVRFDSRLDQVAVRNGRIGDIPSIPLRELRL